eukprot:466584-Rhodomonas_salina.4
MHAESCYAVCGTEIASCCAVSGAEVPVSRSKAAFRRGRWPRGNRPSLQPSLTLHGIVLRACYAMSGTELLSGIKNYAPAMRCLVLSYDMEVLAYPRARRCSVPTQHPMLSAYARARPCIVLMTGRPMRLLRDIRYRPRRIVLGSGAYGARLATSLLVLFPTGCLRDARY